MIPSKICRPLLGPGARPYFALIIFWPEASRPSSIEYFDPFSWMNVLRVYLTVSGSTGISSDFSNDLIALLNEYQVVCQYIESSVVLFDIF